MFTLQRGAQHGVLAIDLQQVTSKANRSQPKPLSPSLTQSSDVIAFGAQNSAAQGASASASAKCAPTLDKSKVPAVLAFNQKQDGADASEIAPTLLAMPHDGSHPNGGGQLAVCITGETTRALTHEGADASEDGTGRGTPVVVGTLEARTSGGGFPGTDGALSGHVVANTIMAREAKGWNPARDIGNGNGTVTHGIPRRLTPRECERLMDWPDDWTLVPDAKGKLLSDAARYKAIGNGVASVHSHWIGWRLRLALEPVGGSPMEAEPQLLAVIRRKSDGKTLVVALHDSQTPTVPAHNTSRPFQPETDNE